MKEFPYSSEFSQRIHQAKKLLEFLFVDFNILKSVNKSTTFGLICKQRMCLQKTGKVQFLLFQFFRKGTRYSIPFTPTVQKRY